MDGITDPFGTVSDGSIGSILFNRKHIDRNRWGTPPGREMQYPQRTTWSYRTKRLRIHPRRAMSRKGCFPSKVKDSRTDGRKVPRFAPSDLASNEGTSASISSCLRPGRSLRSRCLHAKSEGGREACFPDVQTVGTDGLSARRRSMCHSIGDLSRGFVSRSRKRSRVQET